MAKILGFDVSSVSTGWAVLEEGALVACGLIKTKAKTHGERLGVFEGRLGELCSFYEPDLIAVEDIWAGKFIQPALILARYRGIVEKLCWERYRAEPFTRTATELRKIVGQHFGTNLLPGKKERLVTGKGSKQLTFELMERVFALPQLSFEKDNDLTDALCVSFGVQLILDLGAKNEEGEKGEEQRGEKKESSKDFAMAERESGEGGGDKQVLQKKKQRENKQEGERKVDAQPGRNKKKKKGGVPTKQREGG